MKTAKALITTLALVCLLSGCAYKGAKVIEGTDLAIGMELPGSDGVAQLNLLNYLSGFRLAVAKDADTTIEYCVAESNSFFNIIHTSSQKTIKSSITPHQK